jgi:hypothetical protein
MTEGQRNISAVARVLVTIKVSCRSVWGADCNLDQVYKQAEEEALEIVRSDTRLQLYGKPKVKAILFDRDQQS